MAIFIVDDDKDDISLIEEALTKNDYSGSREFYSNGHEVMYRLMGAELMPSLIILDLNMPVKDGYQTLLEIKSDMRLKQIPVVILSTSGAQTDRIKCEAYGCSKFYSKPWTLCEYISIVKDILFLINDSPHK